MANRLSQQVAIITGASRGIDRAIAEAYAAEGAKLCLIATDVARLNEVQRALDVPSERVMAMGLNVTDRDACFAAMTQVEQRFGRVDVLVNNAGVYRGKPFLDYGPQDFQDMLDVNLFGVLNLMQAVLPGMQARRGGPDALHSVGGECAQLDCERDLSQLHPDRHGRGAQGAGGPQLGHDG